MNREVLLGFFMSEKREIGVGQGWVRWEIRGLREWEVEMKIFSACAMINAVLLQSERR